MRNLMFLSMIGAVSGACRPHFNDVESACTASVPGDGTFVAGASEVLAVGRANCYRRYVQLGSQRVDDLVSAASHAHAHYLALNGYEGLVDGTAEDPGLEGYTGETLFERLTAQGYGITAADLQTGWFFWTIRLPTGPLDEAAAVDTWMEHWLFRQVMLQPSVSDAGWGRSGDFTVFENLSPFPAPEHVQHPVVYPRDGQADVPVGIMNVVDTSIVAPGPVGYPITITVGSNTPPAGVGAFDVNPYHLVLLDQFVVDANDNQVAVTEIQPGTYQFGDNTPAPFAFTIALVPDEPLTPDMTYRVFARISSVDGVRTVETSFTTSATPFDAVAAGARAATRQGATVSGTVVAR